MPTAFGSTKRSRRVVIVGAGPAGAACALELARRNFGEVLLIDRSSYPRRKVCGSGLSQLALSQIDALGLLPEVEARKVEIRTLKAEGPGRTALSLAGSKGAWVVPRSDFDHLVVQRAVGFGARLMEETRVQEIVRRPDGTASGVRTRAGEIEADLVVVANGSPSNFEVDDHPRDGIRTIVGWWEGRLPQHDAAMIWDRRLGGYYAWAFPEPGGIMNVGLTIPESHPRSKHLRELFPEILEEHFPQFARETPIGKWAGHPATVTTRVGRIMTARTVFVGEAARLVCPATVEGISYGLLSGRMAADAIVRRFDVQRGFSSLDQHRYRFAVAARMLPMFSAAQAFYRFMSHPQLVGKVAAVVRPERVASRLTRLVGEREGRAA